MTVTTTPPGHLGPAAPTTHNVVAGNQTVALEARRLVITVNAAEQPLDSWEKGEVEVRTPGGKRGRQRAAAGHGDQEATVTLDGSGILGDEAGGAGSSVAVLIGGSPATLIQRTPLAGPRDRLVATIDTPNPVPATVEVVVASWQGRRSTPVTVPTTT